ncbi:hypothetical protein K469DRAFT_728928 [Zopfia rhizophila CBS 207.26]|uniref:FAM192A/Fyv6 N-terminal domain-containing protein n=1 Tax=Zopfia rhizophila CBS 207.26 TaxID=1314779 RepID=A0A6A6DRF5_9PEZI|nr:hypothetical protein K469DRAFT_728928 [Zopfia rhizophila CBS 207.26]
MSSGFVSGGTIDNPAQHDEEWLKAQQELEESRRRKEEEGRQEGGKSLYEVLQANKAAKQEAFEEATRLKNQYRALDEDEAEYLDSILESTRKQEAAVRKETLEQLDLFRKHQEEAEKAALAEQTSGNPLAEDEQWIASGRKRKKGQEKGLLRGVKRRESSTAEQIKAEGKPTSPHAPSDPKAKKSEESATGHRSSKAQLSPVVVDRAKEEPEKEKASGKASSSTSPSPKPNPSLLGLANYSSDEDD